ncbi:MAG: alpha/beta hydrolase [Lachnospiraceae bacterium]|nr:alpha/beta hydrolase [Lachnospiraceae bacterium]
MSGSSTDEESIKKHRASVEKVSKLVTPKEDVDIERFKVGEIDCEAIRLKEGFNPHYVILYAHGGGYLSGGLDYARILAVKMTAATGFPTITFDYKLAPENTYPAALEDIEAVWSQMTGGMVLPGHVILAGDSAGGNLVLCHTQKLIKEGRDLPGKLVLFSPWADMTGEARSYETNGDIDPVLSKEFVLDAARTYAGEGADLSNPRFSPLFGDFEGFPSTFIMTGKNEILIDDSIRLCDRINEAGGKAVLDIEERGWHVYQQSPVRIASNAIKRLSAHIAEEINGDQRINEQ